MCIYISIQYMHAYNICKSTTSNVRTNAAYDLSMNTCPTRTRNKENNIQTKTLLLSDFVCLRFRKNLRNLTCLDMSRCINVRTYRDITISQYLDMYVYICIYVYVFVYIYIHTHIHTYMHTYMYIILQYVYMKKK